MIKYHIINTATFDQPDMDVLKVIHNAGFFSCNTIAFMDVINYFNANKGLPDKVDRVDQYSLYKAHANQNLIPMFFADEDNLLEIPYNDTPCPMNFDCMSIQFAAYNAIPFDHWLPLVQRYFRPSQHVYNLAYNYMSNYNLDFDNLCAVLYRGNDKNREMAVAPYESFIEKAKEIKAANPHVQFLVQPDETEFLEAFQNAFPGDVIHFKETPHMRKQDSAVFFTITQNQRADYACAFFAAIITLSRCKHLITHSGNIGLWATLYRGNATNVHQIFNNQWLS